MNKIKSVSTHIVGIFKCLFVIIPLMTLMKWLFLTTQTTKSSSIIGLFSSWVKEIHTPEGYVDFNTIPWTLPLKMLGLFSDVIALIPLLIGLTILIRIFKNYQQGEIFNPCNAQKYYKLGWLALLDALLFKPVSQTLIVLAVTLSNPPGHRYLMMEFGSPNLKALFIGTLLIIISWVMLEASKIHDEQRFTI